MLCKRKPRCYWNVNPGAAEEMRPGQRRLRCLGLASDASEVVTAGARQQKRVFDGCHGRVQRNLLQEWGRPYSGGQQRTYRLCVKGAGGFHKAPGRTRAATRSLQYTHA